MSLIWDLQYVTFLCKSKYCILKHNRKQSRYNINNYICQLLKNVTLNFTLDSRFLSVITPLVKVEGRGLTFFYTVKRLVNQNAHQYILLETHHNIGNLQISKSALLHMNILLYMYWNIFNI